MKLYRRFLDLIDRVQAALIVVFFVLIVAIVSVQVLNRFWLHMTMMWTADVAVLCFIWLGFLTASSAVRRYGHFRVSILLEMRGIGSGRRLLEILGLLAIVVLSVVLVTEGFSIALDGLREISPGLNVSMFWAYMSVPVCSATSILFAIEKLIDQVRGHDEGHAAPMDEELA